VEDAEVLREQPAKRVAHHPNGLFAQKSAQLVEIAQEILDSVVVVRESSRGPAGATRVEVDDREEAFERLQGLEVQVRAGAPARSRKQAHRPGSPHLEPGLEAVQRRDVIALLHA